MFMKKKLLFYAVFFIALFILFYVALTKVIPGFGEVKLPVLSEVQPFFFTDQDGKIISQKDISGKVYVVEYFFTTCRGICPEMNNNMKEVYAEFKNEPDFRILSHTVDPETDSVARMKHYADSIGADSKTWLFLTGTKDSLYHAARVSYLLDNPKNNDEDIGKQFIHTQFFALVDKGGQVRKIVDGLKKDEIDELKRDIVKLLKEKPGINHFSSPLNGYNVH
jgi:protein SCO1/2